MRYLLSVIIPIYNVEDYIADCLDSIVKQTIGIENIEVIAVNDCTPDNSMEIVKEYALQYPSIKIIHREQNGGAGPARNSGLDHATADYVTFVDPDDFITLNAFEHLLKCSKEHECDIVLYEYEYYSPSGKKYPRNPSAALFHEDTLITDYTLRPEIIFATSVCNKLFHRKLFRNIRFEATKFEDVLVSTKTTFLADKIFVTNKCTYFYRKREDEETESTMDNYLNKKDSYFDHAHVNMRMFELIDEYPQYKELIDWFNVRNYTPFLVGMIKKRFISLKEKKVLYNQARTFLKEVPDSVLNKIENQFHKYAAGVAGSSGFYAFMSKVISFALRDKFGKLFKALHKSVEIMLLIPLARVLSLNPKYKNVWLVCERGYEARDNGYRFFEYLRHQHKEINAYYLIDKKKNPLDYKKIRELGNAVQFKGFKHKLLFLAAVHLISAHKGTIEPWNYVLFSKYFGRFVPKKKYIFLQHGITKDNVIDILGKENAPFDLFITGAKPEYDYVLKHFGYSEHEVAYTGFARFDSLHHYRTENAILLMPTWRNGIMQKSWDQEEQAGDQRFLSSEYYQKFQSLLNNNTLHQLLEQRDYKLIFYPHYEVQKYIHYFKSASNRVIIADENSYDVQRLLMTSALLVTDFSSVFFDFAYMEKPVIYYQFDRDYFFSNHYKKGYFDYDEHGFGEVCKTETELVACIEEYMEGNFALKEKYHKRIQTFFPLKDQQNCQRIYDAIMKLK